MPITLRQSVADLLVPEADALGRLTREEEWWRDHSAKLESMSYFLRRRYQPGWRPSWKKHPKRHPSEFEDWHRYEVRKTSSLARAIPASYTEYTVAEYCHCRRKAHQLLRHANCDFEAGRYFLHGIRQRTPNHRPAVLGCQPHRSKESHSADIGKATLRPEDHHSHASLAPMRRPGMGDSR